MKKRTKLFLGLLAVGTAGTIIKKQKEWQEGQLAEYVVNAAKQLVTDETIIGSWLLTTKQTHEAFESEVLSGGIMTEHSQYEFFADAKTGELLLFEKQDR